MAALHHICWLMIQCPTPPQASPSDPDNFPFVVLGNKVDVEGGRTRQVSRGRGARRSQEEHFSTFLPWNRGGSRASCQCWMTRAQRQVSRGRGTALGRSKSTP